MDTVTELLEERNDDGARAMQTTQSAMQTTQTGVIASVAEDLSGARIKQSPTSRAWTIKDSKAS